MMKLSIITINYNNAEGLERTLNSVLTQTYGEIEHVIVDGGSTDNSVNVIKEYVRKVESGEWNVIWVSEKDNGIYNAMNKGIRKAAGDYVWILNSGDCVADDNVVAHMMDILKKNKYPLMLGNKLQVYSWDKYKPKSRKGNAAPKTIEASMLTFYHGTIPQDAAFVRRDLFEKYGYFDEGMKICADWKLYLNMIALQDIVPMYVDIDVVLFDMTGVSNFNNELRLLERRAYMEQVLPTSVLKDYDAYAFQIEEYKRLRKFHLWGLVYFIERILFKFEKWHILK